MQGQLRWAASNAGRVWFAPMLEFLHPTPAEAKMSSSDEDRQRWEFARQVFENLVNRGLSTRLANALMRAAGPGRAVASLEWTQKIASEWSGSQAQKDAIRVVFLGLPADFGARRHLGVFEVLELVPPPPVFGRTPISNGDLFALIEGVKVVLEWCFSQASQPEKEDES